eukprot:351609-Chlamydomonas_euryale.AAC.13
MCGLHTWVEGKGSVGGRRRTISHSCAMPIAEAGRHLVKRGGGVDCEPESTWRAQGGGCASRRERQLPLAL